MKKRFLSFLLVFCLLVTLSSCNDFDDEGGTGGGMIRFLDPMGRKLRENLLFSSVADLEKIDVSTLGVDLTFFELSDGYYLFAGWDNNGDGKAENMPLNQSKMVVITPVYEKLDGTYVGGASEATYVFDGKEFTYTYNEVEFRGTYKIVGEDEDMRIVLTILERATANTPLTKLDKPEYIGGEEGVTYVRGEDSQGKEYVVISTTRYTKIK